MTLLIKPDPAAFISLSKQEYIDLCDLIICGSQMAEYLLATQRTCIILREHARYWQKLAKKFKPLLHRVRLF